jgi:cytochrome P450
MQCYCLLYRSSLDIVLISHMLTGTDTTAITATYATYCLSTHPNIQEALIREVSTLPSEFKDEDLRQLRILNGVINETLRLHGAVGQGLPRLVPPGGATLCGYYIPESVTVGVQAYSIHRDDTLWPNATEFKPDRWFEPKHDMYAFLPFGKSHPQVAALVTLTDYCLQNHRRRKPW